MRESLPKDGPCTIPPAGWYCTRTPGHEGPCAALRSVGPTPAVERPTEPSEEAIHAAFNAIYGHAPWVGPGHQAALYRDQQRREELVPALRAAYAVDGLRAGAPQRQDTVDVKELIARLWQPRNSESPYGDRTAAIYWFMCGYREEHPVFQQGGAPRGADWWLFARAIRDWFEERLHDVAVDAVEVAGASQEKGERRD
jgi:hypothetical protein